MLNSEAIDEIGAITAIYGEDAVEYSGGNVLKVHVHKMASSQPAFVVFSVDLEYSSEYPEGALGVSVTLPAEVPAESALSLERKLQHEASDHIGHCCAFDIIELARELFDCLNVVPDCGVCLCPIEDRAVFSLNCPSESSVLQLRNGKYYHAGCFAHWVTSKRESMRSDLLQTRTDIDFSECPELLDELSYDLRVPCPLSREDVRRDEWIQLRAFLPWLEMEEKSLAALKVLRKEQKDYETLQKRQAVERRARSLHALRFDEEKDKRPKKRGTTVRLEGFPKVVQNQVEAEIADFEYVRLNILKRSDGNVVEVEFSSPEKAMVFFNTT
uniref:RWD domain-containing protein n=1 Tax=Palpitomonas bilix TaxID=652834 RepID=A0A7S3DJ55_9EUKA|mmetsp:Transcript_3939/g.7476  ORF Transcript_3939/g.7476 Transcript_3939/m.7476 type:complete len:328 (+) Transcript_3939:205-1188(+)